MTSRPVLDPVVPHRPRDVPTRALDPETNPRATTSCTKNRPSPAWVRRKRTRTRETRTSVNATRSRQKEEQQERNEPERREALKAEIENAERAWPLVKGCAALSWERFGRGPIVVRNEDAELRDEAPTPEFSLASEEQLREQRLLRWRQYDEKLPVNARAMRLSGERGKEPFTCVFVIADSR